MAFQLRTKESLSGEITRNVRRQIEKAIKHLDSNEKRAPRGTREKEAVPNEVRKCFKKVRAALRLVRDELGDDLYREANYGFRDAARLLSEVCDAVSLADTADKLTSQPFAETVESGAFAKIHEALLTNQEGVTRRVLKEDKAFSAVQELPLARSPDFRIGESSATIGPLLRVASGGYTGRAIARSFWRRKTRAWRISTIGVSKPNIFGFNCNFSGPRGRAAGES